MNKNLRRLHELDAEIQQLVHVAAVLHWDQETFMPPGAVEGRAEQLALLQGMIHDRMSSPQIGEGLEALGVSLAQPPAAAPQGSPRLPAQERAFLRELARLYRRSTRLPRRLVTELARETSVGQSQWAEARRARDFGRFAGQLERIVRLVREMAAALGYQGHPYDPLLEEYEPWTTTTQVEAVFGRLEGGLKRLVQAIEASGRGVDTGLLTRHYPSEGQRMFSRRVLEAIGYDFQRGRLDESAHPFTTRLGSADVRLTTRYDEGFFNTGIFGTVHECGHGLYEQGVAAELHGSLLAEGASLGIHESQSRCWENLIGRSRPFWEFFFPMAQELFPRALAGVELDSFYRAVNAVAPSPIRVEADEVTYNLHIILRFELEKSIISGDLQVPELPGAWNEGMRRLLGITPPDDARGVLQDIHWSGGMFGYFPTYALGNLYAAQFFEALQREVPELGRLVASGSFAEIREWLRARIHRFGRVVPAAELCRRVTGAPLGSGPLLSYLQSKFGEIYGL